MQDAILQIFKAKAQTEKNVLLSPYCFEIICRIVAEGTKGNVHQELRQLLDASPDEDLITPLFDKIDSLKEIKPVSKIEQTNAIYHRDVIRPVEEFYQSIKKRLHFELKELKEEDIRIEDPQDITFIIESVLDLKTKWKQEFKKISQIHEPFYLANGETKETSFIEQNFRMGGCNTKYFKSKTFHAVQIPMKDNRLFAEIYSPYEKNGLENFVKNIDKKQILSWKDHFEEVSRMHIILPKFELEANYKNLEEDLRKLNVKYMFEYSFDFNPMLTGPDASRIKQITQENKFKLDEIGIEVSSISRMYGSTRGVPLFDKYVLFKANHPFMYLVRDEKTNTILLMGTFDEPESNN